VLWLSRRDAACRPPRAEFAGIYRKHRRTFESQHFPVRLDSDRLLAVGSSGARLKQSGEWVKQLAQKAIRAGLQWILALVQFRRHAYKAKSFAVVFSP
jgi:hypothetical protein